MLKADSPNNKIFFEIREINHCAVQIEAPSCQQFGRTKTYCRKPFACVKCGLCHPTPNCSNNSETPPKCIHCLKQRTENHRITRVDNYDV